MIKDLSDFDCNKLGEIGQKKLLVDVDVAANSLNDWLEQNSTHVKRLFRENGALLIRGLPLSGSKKLSRVLVSLFGEELLEYNYGSTPRTKLRGKIYTSTEYHPTETIPLHNENSYSNIWAMNIAFYCAQPASSGGATPIADSRQVYNSVPPEIRDEFEQRKLMYVRNYGTIDLPWTEVFKTEDRQQVEAYCNNNNIEFEWLGKSNLRTRQVCNAISTHPETMEKVWFNQAHLFHISSLNKTNRENLLKAYKMDDLPRNVYYGDGGEIKCESLDLIRKAYQDNMIIFDWQKEDLLLLDNMLFAHGRLPYAGSRRVLVGMAKSHTQENQMDN